MTKPNILVLCTGNSCRSQMAEGYLRHYADDRFSAHSAGSDPAGSIHPLAIQVMQEDGIDISGQRSKHLKEFLGRMPLRYLIIVCDSASRNCPSTWPGLQEKLAWPFDDPAAFQGSEQDRLTEFRRVRDQIKAHILSWLESQGDPQ